ncbi:hypothetical protein MUK72_16710 (plasmid) [Halococcus dombrowskii]|uniref:Uncharacterized protein n=1 Tax=Halococcus dombrowskii TaxID=179637 RepID=A0AAV3SKX1_HALDO|nr:hypothetical protein [Halococcus dombrowskii]UOO97072.1 hypothetical protein MUK72_16710 [Halococcus dombrowskii]
MPPEGYNTITVPDEVFEQVTEVMIEYDCDSIADAVATASAVALERDEAALARLLAQRLAE